MLRKLLCALAITAIIHETTGQKRPGVQRRGKRRWWTKKRAQALKKKRMAAKIKTNISGIQIQNFGDSNSTDVNSALIEKEFWQDSFNSVVNEDVQFMEKLLYQFGVVEEKTDKERSKIVQDVMTKRARKPSIVKLKSVATSLTSSQKSIFDGHVAEPLYLTEQNYEVPITTKLLREWTQKRSKWFPPNIYNRTWFFNERKPQIPDIQLENNNDFEEKIWDIKKSGLRENDPRSGSNPARRKSVKYGKGPSELIELTESEAELLGIVSHSEEPVRYKWLNKLNYWEQDCVDSHNFFRSLHDIKPMKWSKELSGTAQVWANYLAEFAPVNPEKLTNEKHRTRAWPHSDRVGQRKQNAFAPVKRGVDVGEIVSFDWSHRGTNCSQEVEKWYSEIFFFDPADPLKARKLSPEQGDDQQVGHLTQLLWADSKQVGCGSTTISFPGLVDELSGQRGLFSTYVVCQYEVMGNIVTKMLDNFKPLRHDVCTTFDMVTGKNKCDSNMVSGLNGVNIREIDEEAELSENRVQKKIAGECMGLDNERNSCDCHPDNHDVMLPICQGKCIVQCRNVWNSKTFGQTSCSGHQFCTCSINGAVCY